MCDPIAVTRVAARAINAKEAAALRKQVAHRKQLVRQHHVPERNQVGRVVPFSPGSFPAPPS